MHQIEPGSKVKVTIKRTPLSGGARKTLARLFHMDRRIARTRRRKPKPTTSKRRGGRNWIGRPRGTVTAVPKVGDSCELFCTLDVVRDLASVERYVDVGPV